MSENILVVDDEKATQDMLSRFLTKEGYEVIVASSGEEALQLADKENPRVILLDVVMPGIGGILACKKLKAQENTRFVPVIIVSALGQSWEQAIEAGADEFVQKPIDFVELRVRIRSMLRVAHLTDELERTATYIGELESQDSCRICLARSNDVLRRLAIMVYIRLYPHSGNQPSSYKSSFTCLDSYSPSTPGSHS